MRGWVKAALIVFTPVFLLALLVWYWWADSISLSNGNGHSATILLDARRTNCIDDEVIRADATVNVGNVLSPHACDSRIAALLQDRAMYFAPTVSTWTDGKGDELSIALTNMPELPVSVWVPTGGTSDAKVHLGHARTIYSNMQSGIGLLNTATIVENAGLDGLEAGCSNLAPVTVVGKTAGHINIYYVKKITDYIGAIGIHCEGFDEDVILIRNLQGLSIVAHEVGHTLTLNHISSSTDGVEETRVTGGEVESNLMLQGGENQKLLTTGQSFRANLNATSAINRLGARTGPMPGCHRTDKTNICPSLGFDVLPK